MITLSNCSSTPRQEHITDSPQYRDGKFRNEKPRLAKGALATGKAIARYLAAPKIDKTPLQATPLVTQNRQSLEAQIGAGAAVYRLGHSSLLLQLEDEFWLIDPVFGERASPFSWIGPKRFHPSPVSVQELPDIAGVIISHDHYDHLDEFTVKALHERVGLFVTPLGVGEHLQRWGVDSGKIRELDWWQSIDTGTVELTATPAHHFSGRGLHDGNHTLWASWAIKSQQASIFYSGDSGYFEGFKTIGERLGPFDLAIMENGAYDQGWADIHMHPEETWQAFLDVRGRALLPVHNGTFDLALHPWYEPFERLSTLAADQSHALLTPLMGERLALADLEQKTNTAWWRESSGSETEQMAVDLEI